METKPYSLQSPEQIAKDYGGNKQKIAEAMQMGLLDPTAGTLAGMFIDRMRNAAQTEAAPEQTVAQQVFNPAPSPMPQMPAGLGATPEAAAMSPMGASPEMSAASMPMEAPVPQGEMPMMAMGGMVPPYMSGGLTDAPLPDGMFDENRNGGFNDGYAGGGLVAFSKGGISNLYDDVEHWESRGKQGAVSPKGARGVMQLMPGTMRDPGFGVTPVRNDTEEENRRVGREYLDAMYRKYGDQSTALMAYNWGPGNVDKWLKSGADPKKVPAETRKYVSNVLGGRASPAIPERDVQSAEGRRGSLMDQLGVANQLYAGLPEDEGRKRAIDYYNKQIDPEEQKKERTQDMWYTLAQIGASMASSNSPFFLQSVGEAIAAALPGADASRRERKKVERDAMTALSELYGYDRKEAKEKVGLAVDLYKDNQREEGAEVERNFRASEANKERVSRAKQAELDRQAQIDLAKLRVNPSDMEVALRILRTGTPEEKADLIKYIEMKKAAGAETGPLNALPAGPGGTGATGPTVLAPM
jgi:hypothetical protein